MRNKASFTLNIFRASLLILSDVYLVGFFCFFLFCLGQERNLRSRTKLFTLTRISN